MSKITKGYKGFNKNLTCRDFQYEIGKEYETDKTPIRCAKNGFHFCENPLDVFGYYSPGTSRFCEVEGSGEKDTDDSDSKVAVSKIKIGCEINLKNMIEGGIKFIFDKTKWKKGNSTTGDRSGAQATGHSSGAQATGNSSGAQATGDRSGAQATGHRSMATTNGDYSKSEILDNEEQKSTNAVAMAIGHKSKVKAPLNCWLVLSEWEQDGNYDWNIINVQSAKVDGEKIKPDTFYSLVNGEFVEK